MIPLGRAGLEPARSSGIRPLCPARCALEDVLKVLVTGAAGFVGSNLCEALLARGDEVVALDNFNDFYDPARKRSNVEGFRESPRCRFFEADIRDAARMEEIVSGEGPDAVFRRVVLVPSRDLQGDEIGLVTNETQKHGVGHQPGHAAIAVHKGVNP